MVSNTTLNNVFLNISFNVDIPLDGSIRLMDGSGPHEGRVEVFYDGQWGTVCDDLWELEDAAVACRQLGFPGVLRATTAAPDFAIGDGPINLDDLECYGDERTLGECTHFGWGDSNCDHSEDAGVVCATSETTALPGVTSIPGIYFSILKSCCINTQQI